MNAEEDCLIFGDWEDGSFLNWVEKVSFDYNRTRTEIINTARKCATVVNIDSPFYKYLCFGCSRRLHLILEALDSIFETVPLNAIMRTNALRMRENNHLELLYHALLINVSGALDNAMIFVSKFYCFGLKTNTIQFFKKTDSKLYELIKKRNKELFSFLVEVKEMNKGDLELLRNTVCHRIVPYCPSCVRDFEGYNMFVSEWKSKINDGSFDISLDENPYEINSGTIKFEDIETDGYYYTSIHDSALRYCSVVVEVVQKTINLLFGK